MLLWKKLDDSDLKTIQFQQKRYIFQKESSKILFLLYEIVNETLRLYDLIHSPFSGDFEI